ncbi:MAG: DUF1501 domain-containing protein [Phycisphaeraceae bacterium]
MNYPTKATRRQFLGTAGAAASAAYLASAPALAAPKHAVPKGKAEHCIVLWLGGGPAQIDTFDPKQRGDAKKRVPGSYYDSIDTTVKGIKVCEHLSRTAKVMDRVALLRTVNHDVIDEHAAAVNRMHTGRLTSGTIVYPSLGSIVSHQRGPGGDNVPAYVVMGYPNLTRGPGFLGAKHSYIYLLETDSGPAGLQPPPNVDSARQARRDALLAKLQNDYTKKHKGEERIEDYAAVVESAGKLAGPDFMSAFKLDEESKSLRESYGEEFGQRCLLSRRLIQRGVRFIEVAHNLNFVNGTGWDTHNDGQLKQHVLIDELDRAFSTLITDLESHKLLDKTLIVIAGEFGRPAGFDAGGGRGHQSTAFSCVLAGGGLKLGQAIGETDDMAKSIVKRPISVPDFFATIHATLGIDPGKNLFAGDRPVPITDGGEAVGELFG